jgi:hypothetical protein
MHNVLKAFFMSIKNNQIFTGQNENKYALAEELIKDFICKE